ncbi:membrane-bound lytic murein transglycosylase A [Cricetibacter osteomyelitidis]|uniref:Membrane-bound lytic murein transglycosylase A n=2 Tax=Cricetibacter osteomyelitidis TaxID=1521931 RepID=A0A4R2T5K0_9PAST|nr:murein transglycosylase A [Cricetibacter osteomyelitidis]TCP97700.1 membrane-bound lytic murein transglycosylase A [Cricetibacter osteomyelitidis]
MKLKTLLKATALLTVAALVACSGNAPKKSNVGVKAGTAAMTLEDYKRLGAVYEGRSYSGLSLIPVSRVENQSAVINQGDFLTQLYEVRHYSGNLVNRHAGTYGKVTSWVLSGADVSELRNFGINLQQLSGEDGYQNVLMTGYYIPIFHGSPNKTGKYQHPIYAMPSNKRFTRAQIYGGALEGKGLELAYSTMYDVFAMGVQGSGFMDMGNGHLTHFAYGGQNGYPYAAVGRLLVEDGEIPKEKMSMQAIKEWGERNPSRFQALLERNPSYVFFKRDPTDKPKGAAGVPLISLSSIAVDKNVVPLGSIVLVEMPRIDSDGNWTGQHDLRLVVALDVGGAIKGQHFDLYQGIGDKAGHTAGLLKHYGRAWILK